MKYEKIESYEITHPMRKVVVNLLKEIAAETENEGLKVPQILIQKIEELDEAPENAL